MFEILHKICFLAFQDVVVDTDNRARWGATTNGGGGAIGVASPSSSSSSSGGSERKESESSNEEVSACATYRRCHTFVPKGGLRTLFSTGDLNS